MHLQLASRQSRPRAIIQRITFKTITAKLKGKMKRPSRARNLYSMHVQNTRVRNAFYVLLKLILLQFQVWRQTGGLYYVTTINKCGVTSHPMGAWEHILLKQTFETNF